MTYRANKKLTFFSLFIFIVGCKNLDQNNSNLYQELDRINDARIEAKDLNIPFELVELINFNDWKWNEIKNGYLKCLKHPALEIGAKKETIAKLCSCEMSEMVKSHKFDNERVKNVSMNDISKMTLKCLEISGLRTEMNEAAGLDANTNSVDININYDAITNLYGKNEWTSELIQTLYATSIANESLRYEFEKLGYNSQAYENYSVCLVESIVINLSPKLMISNPEKFYQLSNELAKVCVSGLNK